MGYRKFMSFLISIVMVVVFASAAVSADSKEKKCTTPSGITLTMPKDFHSILWPGIEDNDPALAESGYTKETLSQLYTKSGVEFQASRTVKDVKYGINVLIYELDTPSDLKASFADKIMTPGSVKAEDLIGYGMVKIMGVPLYKIVYQSSAAPGDTVIRLHQYSLLTKSGKMHQINIMLMNDPQNKTGQVPYTEEDYRLLDLVAADIMGSIELSKELAPDVKSPEGAAPYRMTTGKASEYRNITTTSGITLTVSSEFLYPLWPGIDENDPVLSRLSINKKQVEEMYKLGGVEFQCSKTLAHDDDKYIEVIIFERDTPSDLNQSFSKEIQPMSPNSFGSSDMFGYGLTEKAGVPVYRIAYQTTGDNTLRLNQYTLVTKSGKMHQINIMLMSDPAKNIKTYTDEDIKTLEEVTESIMGSLKLSDDLAADVTTPEGAEPFKMAVGEDPTGSVESGNSDASAVQPGTNTDSKSSVNTFSSFFSSFTSWNIPTFVILIALALILLIGIKPSKLREWQEEPLSLDKSKAIQGFAAVCIIVHHLSQELAEQAGVIGFFQGLGVLFVGIFFFFSGYGLYTSLKTKDNYLKGFLKKRFVTILVPFYVCNLIFVAASCICGEKYKPLQLLYVLSGWSLINMHMWYIVEIAILYIAFFLIYRLIKNRTAATVVMSVFVLAMMTGSLMLCHGEDMSCSYWFQGEWWYNASFLFVIGIIFSKHAEGLRKIARKGYYLLLLVFAALTAVLGLQTNYLLVKYSYWSEIPGQDPKYLDKFHCLAFQLPWIFCFVCFLLLIMMKVRFGNPVLKFLGTISLELYLIHNLFLKGLQDGTIFRVKSPGMYVILTILLAIGLATVINGFDRYLLSLITGKKKAAEPALKTGSHIHSIDVMRIVMTFLVVAIHLPFSGKAGDVFITYGKTAVPFFLVICGYFLYRDDSKEMMKRLIKQTKRIFIFYVAANVFYAGLYAIYLKVTEGSFDGMRECFTSKALLDFLLYNFSPFSEHLWYLGSLLYALLIMLLLNKLKIMKFAMFTAPLLVAGYVVLSHLGIGTGVQLRNAILVGLGYTMMGMIIRRFEKKILDHKATAPVLWIVFIICCVTAIFELNGYKQGIAVPFVSCEILVYVIALLCLKYPDFGAGTFAEWLGRECSLTVYIVHMAVIMLMNMTGNNGFFGKYGAVTVFVITTVIAALYKSIKNAVTDKKQ